MKQFRSIAPLTRLTLLLALAIAPALHAATDEKPPRKKSPEVDQHRNQDTTKPRERDRAEEHRQGDLGRHLDRLQARVKELAAADKHEEAERLEGHIREVRKHAPARDAAERGRRPELEKRLAGMEREIAKLHAAGKHEAAEKMEAEVRRLHAELGKPDSGTVRKGREESRSKAELHALRREIEELHRAGKHEEAERLEQRARHQPVESERRPSRHEAEQAEEVEEIERQSHRLENLRRAIDHLREAGVNDLAAELTGEAKAWEKKLDQLIENRGRREQEHHARMAGEVAELRALVGELREQVERLTRRLEERSRER